MKAHSTHTVLLSGLFALGVLSTGCGAAATTDPVAEPAPGVARAAATNGDGGAAANDEKCEHDGHGRHDGRRGHHWDPDGDGRVAIADLPEPMRERAAEFDTNHDGFLDQAEHRAAKDAFKKHMKEEADANHDGTVTDAERQAFFEKKGEERFHHGDKNGDGALTSEEIGPHRWEHLRVADANGDSRITLDEMREAAKAGKLGFRGRFGHHGPKGDRDEQTL